MEDQFAGFFDRCATGHSDRPNLGPEFQPACGFCEGSEVCRDLFDQRPLQSAPTALSTGLEKRCRFREESGLNEHLGRNKSATGPKRILGSESNQGPARAARRDKRSCGVAIVAAARLLEEVPPVVRRSGRFASVVEIGLPSCDDLEVVLRQHFQERGRPRLMSQFVPFIPSSERE